MSNLFDDQFENATEGKAFRRSWYSSLASSTKPEMITIRQVLEAWFREFPDVNDKFDLLGRFQSDNDDQHLAAFFELYCFTLLLAQGFEVEIHQRIDHTKRTQPDFLVKRDNVPLFYLESTTVTDRPEETGELKRLHDVLDYVNRLESPGSLIGVKIVSIGPSMPGTKPLRQMLQRELEKLDPDQLIVDEKMYGRQAVPKWPWRQDGWHLVFYPIPSTGHIQDPLNEPVAVTSSVKSADPWRNLPPVLEGKAKKYGNPRVPYIIAVNDILKQDVLGEFEVNAALFGAGALIGATPVTIDLSKYRATDDNGLWYGHQGPRNRQVSAVLFVSGLVPKSIFNKTPVLWRNPWANHSLDSSLWLGQKWSVETSDMVLTPADGPAAPDVLRLAPGGAR